MNQMSLARRNEQVVSLSARDFIAIAFRRRRVGGVTFAGIFLGAVLSALFLPRNYEAEMKVLVSHDRADSIVTSSANAPTPVMRTDVTEEDLNTEVQLMKSRDLLEKVVTT
ncbi:MAG: hypothetical protein JWO91_3331, partial [Acidobacteriaceae bacterium]|nr:hypothetical protein [Acidobacteriaceae bacterium]